MILFTRTYLGKKWSSLSANPMNDIKDVSSILNKVSLISSILIILVLAMNNVGNNKSSVLAWFSVSAFIISVLAVSFSVTEK